jgi:hypothetical protein
MTNLQDWVAVITGAAVVRDVMLRERWTAHRPPPPMSRLSFFVILGPQSGPRIQRFLFLGF